MPLNAGYEYANAEKMFAKAVTIDEKITAMEEMIRAAPKHKSSEHHVAELKNRLRRFIEKKEKSKKVGKTTLKPVRKEGFQCVLLGLPNSGKSSLLAKLTNAKPKISQNPFTTKEPEVGTLYYKGFKAQVVDLPSIGSEHFDSGIVNTADCIIIVLESLKDLEKTMQYTARAYGKIIIATSKSDLLTEEELRKLKEKIKSKKLNAIIISSINLEGFEELKQKISESMNLIRVYTKEPGKEKAEMPMILKINATVKEAADSIYKGFAAKIKEARITGPSSKFPKQKVGPSHKLKDLDTVEFHTN